MSAAQLSVQAPSVSKSRRLSRSDRRLLLSALPVLLFFLVGGLGPYFVDYDATETFIEDRLLPPGAARSDGTVAPLGTDRLGRDLLAQVVAGARVSLAVGLATVVVAGTIGAALGIIAGYYGGTIDNLLMRVADIQLGFPPMLLAILVASITGPSVPNVILTLSLTRWVRYARVARSVILSFKEREWVEAARAQGASDFHIIFRHLLPFTLNSLLVLATSEFGLVILAEAGLSFLGLGTPDTHPSWGLTISTGRDYVATAWWISAIPGAALFAAVLCIGSFGERVRERLDPHSKDARVGG